MVIGASVVGQVSFMEGGRASTFATVGSGVWVGGVGKEGEGTAADVKIEKLSRKFVTSGVCCEEDKEEEEEEYRLMSSSSGLVAREDKGADECDGGDGDGSGLLSRT